MVTVTRTQPPFIIWTVRRTGGTNFTTRLIEMSGLPVHHEPLNLDRIHGAVTGDWRRDRDEWALAVRMADILKKTSVIKHCVDVVPELVSAALARAAAKGKAYRHLFLVRESSLQRLLSLEYAKRAAVWGPRTKKPDEATDPAFNEPLDVKTLVAQERRGIARLNNLWRQMEQDGLKPMAVTFE